MTGESVLREAPLPGAVLTRVASSHIRVGTFQYFAARGDTEGVRRLADHVIGRHYPQAANADRPYHALLEGVIARQADLVARWLLVGFIHGVMNTDNTSISGETIDYGPCAFMDQYDPATVFSSIDEQGRYAYANQPRIALWNLTRLAECLLPLFCDEQDKAIEEAQSLLGDFAESFNDKPIRLGCEQSSVCSRRATATRRLRKTCWRRWPRSRADFTLTFRRLSDAALDQARDRSVRQLFADPAVYDEWSVRWRQRIGEEPQGPAVRQTAMKSVNPAFIPRNHRVEAVIEAAVNRDDFAPFEELLTVLSTPYEDQPAYAGYADPPEPHQRVLQTFCGT